MRRQRNNDSQGRPHGALAAESACISCGARRCVARRCCYSQLVSNLSSKLQDATARLGRVEWEAAVVGLLSQQPLLTPERIHAGLQGLRPSTK